MPNFKPDYLDLPKINPKTMVTTARVSQITMISILL